MRQKRYKGPNKWKFFRLRVLPVLVLFAVFAFMFGITAFSSGEGDKIIKFGDKQWNIKDEAPALYTTGNKVTFTVDLTEDFDALKNSGEPPAEEPAPFQVTAVQNGTDLTVSKPAPIGPEFRGEYEVSADLLEQDGTVEFTIKFPKDTWANPGEEDLTAVFTVTKDSTPPEAKYTINGQTKIENKYKEKVELTFETDEDVKLYVNDEAKTDWARSGTITLNDNGEYDIYVKDRAGNKGNTVSFGIAKDDARLTVTKGNTEIKNGEAITPGEVKFQVNNPLLIREANITVTKDGEQVTGLNKFQFLNVVSWTYNFREDGKYNVSITIKDRFDTSRFSFAFEVDGTGPAISIKGAAQNANYNEAKEITVELDDPNGVELINGGPKAERTDLNDKTEPYGKFTEEDGIFKQTFDEDGRYTITVEAKDHLGNTSSKTLSFTIDRSKPVFKSSVKNNEYYNNIETITLTVKDYTLKENKAVLVYGGTETPLTFEKKNDFTEKATVDLPKESGKVKEGRYKIIWEATDALENKTEDTIIFTVDTTAPALAVTANGNPLQNGQYFNDITKISVMVGDANYDKEQTTLTVKRNGKTIEEVDGQALVVGDNGRLDFDLKEDGEYEITLQSTDKAGNQGKPLKIKFTVDRKTPELNVSGLEENGYYPNTVVLFTVNDFTLKEAKLFYTYNGETTEIPMTRTSPQETTATVIFGKEACGHNSAGDKTYYVCGEGHYTVALSATDHAGNQAEELTIPFTVDYTAPEITFSGIDNGAYIQSGTLNIGVEENFRLDKITVEVNGKVVKTAELDTETSWSGALSFNAGETKVDDGHYQVKVTAVDEAGNVQTKETAFVIDTVKPEISISGVDHRAYYAKGQDVTVIIDEENFDPDKVQITAVKKGSTEPISFGKNWSQNTAGQWKLTKHFADDGEYTITVNASDKAGNKAVQKSVTFTVDNIDPVISVEGVKNGHNYKSAEVTIRVSDTNIDLDQTELRVTKGGKSYDIGTLEMVEGSTSTAVLTYHFTEEGAYTIRLKTTDKAGRTTELEEDISFIIDSTPPVVTISGVENGVYYRQNMPVTISVVEHNYLTNTVDIRVTKNGEPYADFPADRWKNTAKTSTLSHLFMEDGHYTITVTAVDKAGNGPVTGTVTFTVDKTTPEIEITGVENGVHYNVNKMVTMTITDKNLDMNKVTVTKDGKSYNAGNFSVSGNRATLIHTFSEEGEYDIIVEATDKAGNSDMKKMNFTIDKTAPVITPFMGATNHVIQDGEYINQMFTPRFALDVKEDRIVSVIMNDKDVTGAVPAITADGKYDFHVVARDKAGNQSEISFSFVLDLTYPKLNISGVVDGYFNKDVKPVITYSDENLDEKNTYVTLNGQPFKSGTVLDYEQDYVLKAHIADLAKNITERTIVFTIDKTAPKIRFVEPISEQYFNKVVIPDLIIEDMSSYNIISLTLDGEPYQIGQPIETEGKHVLYFEVKDAAGNIKQLSVEFIIDLTPPKILFEGVEKNGIYYDPVYVKLSLDNLADRFQTITVDGELFTGEVVVRDGEKYVRLNVPLIGKHEIYASAVDEAGNRTELTIPFTIEEKSLLMKVYENKILFGGSIAGIIILLAAIAAFIYRHLRRKQKQKEIADEYYE